MIIYANSADRTVSLEVPVAPIDGTLTVSIKKDGVSVFEVSAVVFDPATGTFSFTLPFFLSQEDAELAVSWKFDYLENGQTYTYNRDTKIAVITPYVSFSTLTNLYGVELTAEEIQVAERAVRSVINAHCGQSFGRSTGVKYAVGSGDNSLALPARLISLTDVVTDSPGVDLYGSYNVAGDGWYLSPTLYPQGGYSIKSDVTDYVIGVNGVIYNPYGNKVSAFQKDVRYRVEGTWGWEYVPEAVQEATKLLINDYAGPDSTYRDRYLASLTSPDWRIQFHSGAFRQTGNVRADQLLSDYVLKRGWAVI